jgi:hypothetical protein
MLRDHLKCPVCGESETICELSGCDQISDVSPEAQTGLLSFVLRVGDKFGEEIWEAPLHRSHN